MKNLRKDIEKTKAKLIRQVKKYGLYENFGQREIRKLEDKHIDLTMFSENMNRKRDMLSLFESWCENYTGKDEKSCCSL